METGRAKKVGLLIGMLFWALLGIAPQAASLEERIEEVRIEQVQAVMPQMRVYYYREQDGDVQNIRADFGGENLAASEQKSFKDSGEGIGYYVLLDVSASISRGYFADIKEAVGKLQKGMRPQDQMTVITFGDQVQLVCEKETAQGDVAARLQEVSNRDMNTLLFQAIDQTAELIGAETQQDRRNVILCFTDGEDFSENKATNNEALATLSQKNIPLYAMAVRKTSSGKDNAFIDEFGEFARSTGAYLTVFGEGEAWKELKQVRKNLMQAKVLTLLASNNHTSQEPKMLTLEFEQGTKASKTVVADQNVPDETAPTAAVEKTGSNRIQIAYSEAVEGAGDKNHYIIKDGEGKAVAVYASSYDGKANLAVLTFGEDLANGSYTIAFEGVHDTSMEANPVTDVLELTVTDAPLKDEDLRKVSEEESFMEKYGFFMAAALAVAILGGTGIAVIAIQAKKKEETSHGGTVILDSGAVIGKDVQVKQHIALQRQKGRSLIFEFQDANHQTKQIPVMVSGSLIVGRTQLSDVYIDDEFLSKQHFAISESQGEYYIEDLNTKNGTMVNGIRIQGKRALRSGDLVQAGRLEMRVRW